MKAMTIPGGSSKISATKLKKGDVYQQAIKSGAKGLPYLKVLEGGMSQCGPDCGLSIILELDYSRSFFVLHSFVDVAISQIGQLLWSLLLCPSPYYRNEESGDFYCKFYQ